jgi:DNA-binding CsgD family transcriptional regulator
MHATLARMSGEQGDVPRRPELTASELRLLPLLTTSLSLSEIARALELPADAVSALTQSIYAKLDLIGDGGLRPTGL